MSCLFCFFFQAEDGIRDLTVTGVQTCALPISVGREEEVGDAHGLEHTTAHGARPREQRRVELGARERQIERLVRSGEQRRSRRTLHRPLPDLVDLDGGAGVVRERGKAPQDAVADAPAARLVAWEPLLVEKQRGHATRGERHRGHSAGGTAADDDDVRPGPHDAGPRRHPRQASAAAVPCQRTSPSTHTTEIAPLRKPPARTAGPWSTTATTVQTTLAQNVMTHPTRRPWPTPTIPHTWSAR